jgi:hypothetical protein
MWLAVVLDALFGPDIKSADNVGNVTIVPSAVVLALFASLASWVVAKYGFGRAKGAD